MRMKSSLFGTARVPARPIRSGRPGARVSQSGSSAPRLSIAPRRNCKEVTMIMLFTDGSAIGNPGPGGWAVLLRTNRRDQLLSGHCPEPTTNNRMELTAVLEGLTHLDRPDTVTIVTDSEYVRGVLSLGWKRRANLDLLAALDELVARHRVRFQVVRGHSGHPENELVDQAAQAAARVARR